MKLRRVALVIPMVVAILVGIAGPASADYHYLDTPTHVVHDGISFYLMVEFDVVSDHIRAEGRIVSVSGLPGRINWIHLFLDHSGSSDIVANYSPPGGLATNTSVSGFAGPVLCNSSTLAFYHAQMSIHEDGTAWTTTIATDSIRPSSCT